MLMLFQTCGVSVRSQTVVFRPTSTIGLYQPISMTLAAPRWSVPSIEPMKHAMELSAEWASNFARSQTASEVSMAVAKKALDQQRAEGQAVIKLLESATQITADTAASVGGMTNSGQLDLYA
jgi:Putative motility protein